MTPRLLATITRARVRRIEREQNERVRVAWLTAALGRMPPKQFPRNPDTLMRRRVPVRQQSSKEFWSNLSAAVVAAGGKVAPRERRRA